MPQHDQAGGFSWARLGMGSKGLLITGVLTFIGLFLPWQTVEGCEEAAVFANIDCTGSGFSVGLGVLVAILAIALIAWEGIVAAGVKVSLGTMSPALLSAILGGATVLFGLITFLQTFSGGGGFIDVGPTWGAFIGLVFLLAMAYASYVRFQESKVGAAPPPMA